MVKVFVFFLLTLVYNFCHIYFVNLYMYPTKFGSHTGYIHVSLIIHLLICMPDSGGQPRPLQISLNLFSKCHTTVYIL